MLRFFSFVVVFSSVPVSFWDGWFIGYWSRVQVIPVGGMFLGLARMAAVFVALVCLASYLLTKNLLSLLGFTLYWRAVLQATKCINLGFDSLITAGSFFLITVFLRLFVSSVMVVVE